MEQPETTTETGRRFGSDLLLPVGGGKGQVVTVLLRISLVLNKDDFPSKPLL